MRTELQLTCQRCLQGVRWPVERVTQLQLVENENAATHVDEPLVLESGGINPRAVIEDELILALPVVARHPDSEQCTPNNPAEPEDEPPSNNPFEVLRQLKS